MKGLKKAACGVAAAVALYCVGAGAAQPTREEVEAWLAQAPAVLPAAGSVLGKAELEGLKSLIPPGYLDQFNDPNLKVTIEATGDYPPPQAYQEATAANAGKARLTPEGDVQDYTAGQPFNPEKFDDVSPAEAGLMLAWDHVYRWQYYGYRVKTLDMVYVQPTADGKLSGSPAGGMEGGGRVERALEQFYHRVYLNHLAMLPQQGYKVNGNDSDLRYFKDYISFVAPFDVAGTTFIVERGISAAEEDQVTSYLPTQRRVRRLSAKERADNFMGSNFTLDDFEGFSGRVMDFEWTYRGTKQVLHVSNSREKTLRFGGSQSNVAIDQWQVRPCFVAELKPRWSEHPMSSKFLLIDQQTMTPTMALMFDRQNKLWRIIVTHYQRPVPDNSTPARAFETSVGGWRGSIAYDLGTNSTTIARATTPTEWPTMSEKEIKRTFSVSRLNEGR